LRLFIKKEFMKKVIKFTGMRSILTLLSITVMQVALMAQDQPSGSSTTTVTTHQSSTWYSSPWVWVVGAALFILLLIALLRGGSRNNTSATSDRVTVTKTVSRDTP
jgi:hypothetical protein